MSKNGKKTSAKIVGVKSVMKLKPGETVIASFGKGNQTNLEAKVSVGDNDEPSIIYIGAKNSLSIDAKTNNSKFLFENKNRHGSAKGTSDKLTESSGMDILGLKGDLEYLIFGTKFQDNIHIQIVYKIFGIYKALISQINNVVYTLNCLDRECKEDIVGYVVDYNNSYDDNNSYGAKRVNEYNAYYDNAKTNFMYFYHMLCNKREGYEVKSKEEAYKVFQVINYIRNKSFHGESLQGNSIFEVKNVEKTKDSGIPKQIVDFCNDMLKEQVDSVNHSFFESEKNNFYIVTKAMDTLKYFYGKTAGLLYDFSINKSYKTLGFSLRTLREAMFDVNKEELRKKIEAIGDQKLTSVRHKLYKAIDFVIYYFLEVFDKKQIKDSIVDELRAANDDKAKENVYRKYANMILSTKTKDSIIKAIQLINNNNIFKQKISIEKSWISEEIIMKAEKFEDFSKLIYVFCRFLDGKEINILLNSMINKFKAIDSFNAVIRNLELKEQYNVRFNLFERSGKVASELEFIKSITKMSLDYSDVSKHSIYRDAIASLRSKDDKRTVDDIYSAYFGKDAKYNINSFFTNNVVNSNRFRYIVKYIKPVAVYSIAHNKAIVSHVISRMPEKQIDRYYESVMAVAKNQNVKVENYGDKRKTIVDGIINISFDDFEDEKLSAIVPPKAKGKNAVSKQEANRIKLENKNKKLEREHKKALISLYYTVAYIFVKNLVQINGQYSMAFFFTLRDEKLCGLSGKNFDVVTNKFVTEALSNTANKKAPQTIKASDAKKLKRYLSKDFRDKANQLYTVYRNKVDHLSVLSSLETCISELPEFDSYFGAYHFLMQNCVLNELDKQNKIYHSCKIAKQILETNSEDNPYNLIESYVRNELDKQNETYDSINEACAYVNKTLDMLKNKNQALMLEELDKKIESYESSRKAYDYVKGMIENKSKDKPYSKSLLLAMNVPFGYVTARYKNLSYEKLFNRTNEDETIGKSDSK